MHAATSSLSVFLGICACAARCGAWELLVVGRFGYGVDRQVADLGFSRT